jgi:hypothetical protein
MSGGTLNISKVRSKSKNDKRDLCCCLGRWLGWKIAIIEKRNKDLAAQLEQARLRLKYHNQLFIKWFNSH